MSGTRFQIRIDPWWQPLLLVGGATRARSYIELSGDALAARFGWLFGHTLTRDDIEGAGEIRWPLWAGIGWRTNLSGRFGLIGSYQGIVEIRLRRPIRAWRVLDCRRLAVSLEEPERFLASLGES